MTDRPQQDEADLAQPQGTPPDTLLEGPGLVAAAKKRLASHEYAQAIELLERLPEQYRTSAAEQLLEQARTLQAEADRLFAQVRQAVRDQQYAGLRPVLERLLSLEPDNILARETLEKLARHGPDKPQELSPAGRTSPAVSPSGGPQVASAGYGRWFGAVLVLALLGGGLWVGAEHWQDTHKPGKVLPKVQVPKRGKGEIVLDRKAVVEQPATTGKPAAETVEKPSGPAPPPASAPTDPSSKPESPPSEPATSTPDAPAATASQPSEPAPPPAIAPFDTQQAKEHQAAWAKYLSVPVEFTNSIGMKLVLIPPGEFDMGSMEAVAAKLQDEARAKQLMEWHIQYLRCESPKHRVRITKPFYLGRYEATQAEYERVEHRNPSHFKGDPNLPVEVVTWDESAAFCRALGQRPEEQSRQGLYRLPTAAEWEYACRAGTTTAWYATDEETALQEQAWFVLNAGGTTHPVGQKAANAWGLHDMHGNVLEWCQDRFFAGYYGQSPEEDPLGPPQGSFRVLRGGSYQYWSGFCRSAFHYAIGPVDHNPDLGFRVAMSMPFAGSGATDPRPSDARDPAGPPQSPDRSDQVGPPAPMRPSSVPMNGLAGMDFLTPTEFPQQWLSNESLARITGPGRIVFPTVPVSWYVLEAEVTSRKPAGKLLFRMGDRDCATLLQLGHAWEHVDKDVEKIRCRLFKCDPFGVNWNGQCDYEPGSRLQLRIVVPDAQKKQLYVNGAPALSCAGIAADLTLEIIAEGEVDATIHSCALRKLTEEDVKNLDVQMPRSQLAIDGAALALRRSQQQAALADVPKPGEAFAAPTTGTMMNWISPGEFVMGSLAASGMQHGKGAQRVQLTKGYWIGRYEVTQGEWERLVGGNLSRVQGSPYLPVNWISWGDAVRFCQRLTEIAKQQGQVPEGYEYRLPTEAEWEYACLAGAEQESAAAAGAETGRLCTAVQAPLWRCEVGDQAPNAWGLYDLLGNVPEWCADAWRPYPADGEHRVIQDRFERGNPDVEQFVVKGGPWLHWDTYVGSASARFRATPTVAGDYRGFRLVLGRELGLQDVAREQKLPGTVPATVPAKQPTGPAPPPAVAPFDATKAKEHQAAWAKHLGVPVELENWNGMRFVLIPPGEFDMGWTEAEVAKLVEEAKAKNLPTTWYSDRLPAAAPKHRVRITQPFYLGRCEVTQAEYARVGFGNVQGHFQGDPNRPMESVSWEEASAFCQNLGFRPQEQAAQAQYRLPSEAEWEYACRAGTTTAWYCGDDEAALKEHAWFRANAEGTTHPVGQKVPNAWGLYDMHGNAWEWCQDWFAADYYRQSPAADPTGPPQGTFRVHRGGSWFDLAEYGRGAYRGWYSPNGRNGYLGFRVARSVSVKDRGAEGPAPTTK